MLCYLDRTFCTFWQECKDGSDCFRALTNKVKEDAEKWMKNGPICTFIDKPECFKQIPEV